MKYLFFLIPSFLLSIFSFAQKNVYTTKNSKFSDKINSYLSFNVPIITVNELKNKKDITILDAREFEEYSVSHIPGAKYIGYKNLENKVLENIPKDKTIAIYCSIGYRSEKIGEKLKKKGYTNVYNLYGSIFEWANENLPLQDQNGTTTKRIHVYNKSWGKWMENSNYTKVY
jgi:rhodanese-related sulfurtransferase